MGRGERQPRLRPVTRSVQSGYSRPRDRAATRSPSRDRAARPRYEISLKRGSETAQALAGGWRHVQDCAHSSRRLRDSGTSKSENPVARGDPVSCDRVAKRERTGHSAASCLLPLLASVPSPLDEVELSSLTPPLLPHRNRSTRSCPPSDVCHRSRASRVRSGAALDEHEVASASTIHRVTTRLIFRISGHRSVTSHGITRRGPRSGTRAPVGSALVSRTTKTDPRLGLSSFDIRVGDTCS